MIKTLKEYIADLILELQQEGYVKECDLEKLNHLEIYDNQLSCEWELEDSCIIFDFAINKVKIWGMVYGRRGKHTSKDFKEFLHFEEDKECMERKIKELKENIITNF